MPDCNDKLHCIFPERNNCFSMCPQCIMGNPEAFLWCDFLSRCMNTTVISQSDKALWLIQSKNLVADISKILCYYFCIFCKPVYDFFIEPAAFILQCLRKFPVIKGHIWLNAVFLHFKNHITIECHRFFIDSSGSLRHQSRPAYGKTVCLHTEFSHQRIVLFITVHVIGTDIGIMMFEGSSLFGKGVPDAGSCAIVFVSSFYLIGTAGNAPYKVFSKHLFSS